MADSPTPKLTPANKPLPTGDAGAARPANPALAGLLSLFPQTAPSPSPWAEGGVGVAYSGGADSTALLLAAVQRWPGRVHALHINHGLQAAAADFVCVCETVCAGFGVPLHVVTVDARHASGESPEDAARRSRYAALAQVAAAQSLGGVLLGQHADDQVETLLLALSRGAGLPGLSAMPAQFERHGMRFHRPLLRTPAAALRQWLVDASIDFIDDPSNRDERYTRNRIRARLLPVLQETFPQFRETFARSAQHAAQAQAVLVEVAEQDLATVGSPPDIRALQALSAPRQANVLRHWLLQRGATPSAAHLDQLLGQVSACTTRGHRIHLKIATGHVTRDGPVLAYADTPRPA